MRNLIAVLAVWALVIGMGAVSPEVAVAEPLGEPPPADVVGDPANDALGALVLWLALPFLIICALSSMGRSRRRTTNTRTVRQPEVRMTLRSRSLPRDVKFTVQNTRRSRTIPQDVKIAVTLRDEGKCRVCGSKKDLQYDHIYPWSLGGAPTNPTTSSFSADTTIA